MFPQRIKRTTTSNNNNGKTYDNILIQVLEMGKLGVRF